MISDGDRESSDRCQHYLWSGQQDNIDKRTPVKINPRLGNQTPPANLLKIFLITILLQDIYRVSQKKWGLVFGGHFRPLNGRKSKSGRK